MSEASDNSGDRRAVDSRFQVLGPSKLSFTHWSANIYLRVIGIRLTSELKRSDDIEHLGCIQQEQ